MRRRKRRRLSRSRKRNRQFDLMIPLMSWCLTTNLLVTKVMWLLSPSPMTSSFFYLPLPTVLLNFGVCAQKFFFWTSNRTLTSFGHYPSATQGIFSLALQPTNRFDCGRQTLQLQSEWCWSTKEMCLKLSSWRTLTLLFPHPQIKLLESGHWWMGSVLGRSYLRES